MSAIVTQDDWTGPFDGLEEVRLSTEIYRSPEIFELERRKVFAKEWLYAGREHEIPNPGDFVVREIEVCNASILIVRGKDRSVRAFHNVCSHRCNLVEPRPSGHALAFRCKYHGWVYKLDGTIQSIPYEAGFGKIDKSTLGLTPIAVATWQDFIFINLDAKPQQTFSMFLGEWGRSVEGFPFHLATECTSLKAEVACNWKLALDPFQEAFHFTFTHAKTAGPPFTTKASPYVKVYDVKLYERHRHFSSPEISPEFVPSALDGVIYRLAHEPQTRPLTEALNRIMSDAGALPGINPKRDPRCLSDMHVLFPNISIHPFPTLGFVLVYQFWPLAIDRTRIQIDTFWPPAQTNGQRLAREFDTCAKRDIFLEDFSILERTQKGIQSGAKKEIVLCDKEILIRHMHKVLNERLRS